MPYSFPSSAMHYLHGPLLDTGRSAMDKRQLFAIRPARVVAGDKPPRARCVFTDRTPIFSSADIHVRGPRHHPFPGFCFCKEHVPFRRNRCIYHDIRTGQTAVSSWTARTLLALDAAYHRFEAFERRDTRSRCIQPHEPVGDLRAEHNSSTAQHYLCSRTARRARDQRATAFRNELRKRCSCRCCDRSACHTPLRA